MKDLKQKTIRGGFARLIAQAVYFLLRIGSLMVLARLLGPKDFGLVGMVTAFTGVLGLFRDFGLSTATVQRLNVSEEQVSTLFWVNVLVGAILTVLSLAAAPLVAAFYHEPSLLPVTAALAVAFLFNAAGVQHSARLQRQMRFTALAVINIVSQLVGAIVAVVMAVAGYRYWALVGMTLSIPLVTTIGLWASTSWIPGRPRRQVGLRSILRFGGTISLNSLVVYIAYNFDKVLLGRFWGAQAVGIYGRAYQFINIPTDNLNFAVGEVAFSALSRVQDDPVRFRSYFLKGYSLVVALTIPITLVCALFARDLVLVLLGPKWNEAVPIFRLLAPTIVIFAMINPLGWVMFALGMVGRSLKIALVLAPVVITGYVAGLHYGPKGVAFGFSAMLTLWLVPHIAWCVHGTPVSFWDVARTVGRPLISSVVAAGAAVMVQFFLGQALSPLLRLLLGTTVLLAVYLAMLIYAMGQKEFYWGLLRDLRSRPAVAEEALVSA